MKKIISFIALLAMFNGAYAATSTRTVTKSFDIDKPTTMSFNISNIVQGDPLVINWTAMEGSTAADLSDVTGVTFYIKNYPDSDIIATSDATILVATNGTGTVSFTGSQMSFTNYLANIEVVAQFSDLTERTFAQGLINLSQQFVTGTEDNWTPPTGYTLGQCLAAGNDGDGYDIDNIDDIILNRILITDSDALSAGLWTSTGNISIVPLAKVDVTGQVETDTLVVNTGSTFPAGDIITADIADDAVTVDKIADDAVGDDQLQDTIAIPTLTVATALTMPADSITADEIAAGAVGTSEVADNTLTADDLAANSVGNSELQDTITIPTLTVTSGITIPAGSIDAAEIASGAVGTSELADISVTNLKLAPDSVGSVALQDSISIGYLYVTSLLEVPNLSIDSDEIANGAIGTTKLADDSVDSAKLKDILAIPTLTVSTLLSMPDGTVGTDEIADGSVADADISSDFVHADEDDALTGTYTLSNPLIMAEQVASPTTPPSGYGAMFAKSNNLYFLDDEGNERSLLSFSGTNSVVNIESVLIEGNNANLQSLTGAEYITAESFAGVNPIGTYDPAAVDTFWNGDRHMVGSTRGHILSATQQIGETGGEVNTADGGIALPKSPTAKTVLSVTHDEIYDGLYELYDNYGGSVMTWLSPYVADDETASVSVPFYMFGGTTSWYPRIDNSDYFDIYEYGGESSLAPLAGLGSAGGSHALGWSYKPSNTIHGAENAIVYADGSSSEDFFPLVGIAASGGSTATSYIGALSSTADGLYQVNATMADFLATRQYLSAADYDTIYNSGTGISPFAVAYPEHVQLYRTGNGTASRAVNGATIGGQYSWPWGDNITWDSGAVWHCGDTASWSADSLQSQGQAIQDIVLWLRADDLVGTYGDGEEVLTWSDISGNGYDATGSTGSAPTLDLDGFNGRPTLSFDGTEWLTSLSPVVGDASIFIVSNSSSPPYTLSAAIGGTSGYPVFLYGDTPSATPVNRIITSIDGYVPGSSPSTSDAIFSAILDDMSSLSLYRDGTPRGTDSSITNPFSTSVINIGARLNTGTWPHIGDIAEIIIINSALDLEDRQWFEGYLAWKYGLQGNLVAGHGWENNVPVQPLYGGWATIFDSADSAPPTGTGLTTANQEVACFPIVRDDGQGAVQVSLNDISVTTTGDGEWTDGWTLVSQADATGFITAKVECVTASAGAINQFQVLPSLITGGNFETADGSWTLDGLGAARRTTYAWSGTTSLKMAETEMQPMEAYYAASEYPAGAYAFSAMARAESGTATLNMGFRDTAAAIAGAIGSPYATFTVGTDWQRISAVVTLKSATTVSPYFYCGWSDVAYVDDFSVVALDEVPLTVTTASTAQSWTEFADPGTLEGSYDQLLIDPHDEVTVPASVLNTSEGTISFWARPTVDTPSVGARNLLQSDTLALYIDTLGRLAFKPAGSVYAVSGNNALAINTWTHVTVTWDGSNHHIYLDGELAGSAVPNNTPSFSSVLYIGAGLTGFNALGGYMANLGIWKRALSPEEIWAVANAKLPVAGQLPQTEHEMREIAKYVTTTAIDEGDAVCIDANGKIGTTTTAGNDLFLGIALGDAAIGEEVWVGTQGIFVADATGTINIGDLIETSTTAGAVEAVPTPQAGTAPPVAMSAASGGQVTIWIK